MFQVFHPCATLYEQCRQLDPLRYVCMLKCHCVGFDQLPTKYTKNFIPSWEAWKHIFDGGLSESASKQANQKICFWQLLHYYKFRIVPVQKTTSSICWWPASWSMHTIWTNDGKHNKTKGRQLSATIAFLFTNHGGMEGESNSSKCHAHCV